MMADSAASKPTVDELTSASLSAGFVPMRSTAAYNVVSCGGLEGSSRATGMPALRASLNASCHDDAVASVTSSALMRITDTRWDAQSRTACWAACVASALSVVEANRASSFALARSLSTVVSATGGLPNAPTTPMTISCRSTLSWVTLLDESCELPTATPRGVQPASAPTMHRTIAMKHAALFRRADRWCRRR